MPIVPRNWQIQILVDSWNRTCDHYWSLLAHVCLVLRCCVMATFRLVKWCQIHHFHSFPSLSILYLIDNARYRHGMHGKVLSYFKERQHSMHPYHQSRLILLGHFIYLDLDQTGPNRINEGWSWRKHQTLPQTSGRGFMINDFHFLNQHGSLVSCSNMAQLWVVHIWRSKRHVSSMPWLRVQESPCFLLGVALIHCYWSRKTCWNKSLKLMLLGGASKASYDELASCATAHVTVM